MNHDLMSVACGIYNSIIAHKLLIDKQTLILSLFYLEGGAGNVVDARKNFHRLLEHDSEGTGCSIAAEACVVLTENCVAVCMYDLHYRKTCTITTWLPPHFHTSEYKTLSTKNKNHCTARLAS